VARILVAGASVSALFGIVAVLAAADQEAVSTSAPQPLVTTTVAPIVVFVPDLPPETTVPVEVAGAGPEPSGAERGAYAATPPSAGDSGGGAATAASAAPAAVPTASPAAPPAPAPVAAPAPAPAPTPAPTPPPTTRTGGS
jgi:hypothetical protein